MKSDSLPSLSLSSQPNVNIEAPEIPYNLNEVFIPLRKNDKGDIIPIFQYVKCVKRFLGICTKNEMKKLEFHNLEWFYLNEWVLIKKPSL